MRPLALRIAGQAVAAAVALILIYAILATARSAALIGEARFDDALAANPWSVDAAVGAAATALGEGDRMRADALARMALSLSPVRADALSTLAYAIGEGGDRAMSAKLMSNAARLSWRDETAQLWKLGQEMDTGAYGAAVYRMDALLEQDLHREQLLENLRHASSYSDGQNALVERLAERPKWRAAYLGALAGLTAEGYADHERVLRRLRFSAAPPSSEEIDAFLARLVGEGRFLEARAALVHLTPPTRSTNLVNDAEFAAFDRGESSSPFSWKRQVPSGLSIALEPNPLDPSTRHLTVRSTSPYIGPVISQLLILPPGRYRLIGDVRGGRVELNMPLDWTLTCVGGADPPGAGRPVQQMAGGWSRLHKIIVIPSEGCPAQRLELVANTDLQILDARAGPLRLRKLSAGPPATSIARLQPSPA